MGWIHVVMQGALKDLGRLHSFMGPAVSNKSSTYRGSVMMTERKVHKEVVVRQVSPFSKSVRLSSKALCERADIDLTSDDAKVTCLDCREKMEVPNGPQQQ